MLQKISKAEQNCSLTKIEILTLANRGHWDNYTRKGLNHSPDKREAEAYIIKLNKSRLFFLKMFGNSRPGALGNGPDSCLIIRNITLHAQDVPNGTGLGGEKAVRAGSEQTIGTACLRRYIHIRLFHRQKQFKKIVF